MGRLLPQVAKENLRIATLAINAQHPGATDIHHTKRNLRALRWRMINFMHKGKEGMCILSLDDDRCVIDWPIPTMGIFPPTFIPPYEKKS